MIKLKFHMFFAVLTVLLFGFFMEMSLCQAAGHGEAEKKEEAGAAHGAEGEGEAKKGKEEKGNSDITGGRFAGDPVYVHLQPFNLSVIRRYGAEQLATFVIDLEVKDMSTAGDLYMKMPKIKDSLLETLYVGMGNGSLLINGITLDIGKVKIKCKENLDKLLGEGLIQNVLIQNVVQRQM